MKPSIYIENTQSIGLIRCFPWIATVSFALLLVFANMYQRAVQDQQWLRPQRGSPPLLSMLLRNRTENLASISIARMNLLCASGLGTEANLVQCESALRNWAEHIKSETDRHLYRFRRNPDEFENSEGYYRMLMMSVVLAEDFGIHYVEQKKSNPLIHSATGSQPISDQSDDFFAEADDVFLTGLLGPRRQGTCSSMPVLYLAIGRELGYLLKLVTTKGHLFVRWDGGGERFNIEATVRGLARFEDEYYRHWLFEITPAEEASEGYLKSLPPAGELAVFMSIRGMCLQERGRFHAAAEAFGAAARLAPSSASYQKLATSMRPSEIASRKQRLKSKGPPL